MKFVAVSGAREGVDPVLVAIEVMKALLDDGVLVVGEARGVDTWAQNAAEARGKEIIEFRADWKNEGRNAGLNRNGYMIVFLKDRRAEGFPCEVLAFPGPESKGTWDLVRKARLFGFPVTIYYSDGRMETDARAA